MKLVDYIREDLCFVLEDVASRDALLSELCERIAEIGGVDAAALHKALLERESKGSTATPEGVAIPHAMLKDVEESFVAATLIKGGVDFRSPHGKPVDVVFVLVGPKDKAWEHVRVLARVARVCHAGMALANLRQAETAEGLYARLVEEDERHG